MNEIRWSPLARSDLATIEDHYAEIAPAYSERVRSTVLAATRLLAEKPHVGRPLGIVGARKWSVSGMPYIVLYRPNTHGILILRIHHSRQNWRDG